jgi:iron complex outermembrane receptor protein
LPLSSAAGQLAADFVESAGNGRPVLGTEDATNFSLGIAFDFGNSSWTIDYYNIEVEDRVALGANVDFLNALMFTGGVAADADGNLPAGYGSVSEALTTLDAAGTIDRQLFVGLDDLKQFRFFSNSFDTTTSGIDVVGSIDFSLGDGESTITVAANFNDTEVDDRGTVNPIGAGRVESLEDLLPSVKGNVAWRHSQGKLRTMVRANYYGGWKDTGNGYDVGAETLIDAQVAYDLTDKAEVVVGVENLFDAYPDENPGAGGVGQLYPEASPFGFIGSTWYVQGRYVF